MEKEYQDMTISEWLEYSFRNFDSLLFIDDYRIFVGGNILEKEIKNIDEAVRQKEDELASKGLGRNGDFAPKNSEIGEVNEFQKLCKEQNRLYKERKESQQKLYGIKAGRHALAKIDKLLGKRSLRDRVFT